MATTFTFQLALVVGVLCSLPYLLHGQFNPQFPGLKTWWAKRVADTVFVAGRLSETQIKFASEDGFRSLVSIFNHSDDCTFGSEKLPATSDAKYIAEDLSNLQFAVLCPDEDNDGDDEGPGCWRNVEAINEFEKLYNSLAKPVLVYSNTGYSAAFVAIASLLSRSAQGGVDPSNFIDAHGFYKRASGLGYNFADVDDLEFVVYKVSGGQEVRCPERPNLTKPKWYRIYWWLKPVDLNWYVAGQIQSDHFNMISKFAPPVVMNDRLGVSWEDSETGKVTKSQEEVALLNVNFTCSTYCNGGRQLLENLLGNRINPNKSSEYVSPESSNEVNYWSNNTLEFGDEIGYNETTERLAFKELPFEYVHTPIGGAQGYDKDMYEFYKNTFFSAHLKGTVLSHCTIGFRSVITAVLTVGQAQQKTFDWAIERARLVGYTLNEATTPEVIKLFKYVFRK